jgi:hypothetical protein
MALLSGMRWRLETLYPGIYHLRFGNAYDAAMHFVRYQENYESPVWRDKIFTMIEYMDWYAKTQTEGWENKSTTQRDKFEMFSYPSDWGGFNVPSYVFDRLNYETIPDLNIYDEFMQTVVDMVRSTGVKKFYLIGTTEGPDDEEYLDHEISHGLFYTNEPYRRDMVALVAAADPAVTAALTKWLLDGGYCEEVVIDECAAYLATGLPSALEKNKAALKAQEPFKKLFKNMKKVLG